MDPDTPGTNYDASAPGPSKRKRGRPLNGSQLHPVGSVPTSNDITIGQVVSGFIEASFDGGYLLALRAENSETTMRGVVFKHGRYVPVSAENDVAPDVKMIKRCEIPQQTENLSNLHHSRGKIGAAHHPPSFSPSSLMSTGGKELLPVTTQVTCPTPLTANAVSVLLQQATSANGSLVSTHSHPVPIQDVGLSSVGTQMPPVPILGSHTLNGSTVTKPSGDQDLASAGGAQNQLVGQGLQSRAPFENLMTEVNRRIQHPTPADGNQNESINLIGKSTVDEVSDADDQPLYVEPLQTRQPVLTCNPNLIPPLLDNDRSAKMTQLLQAVQENAAGNILSQNQIPSPPSNPM